MKTTIISALVLALFSSAAAAAPVLSENNTELPKAVLTLTHADTTAPVPLPLENSLEKRGAALAIAGAVGTEILVAVVSRAADFAVKSIQNLNDWTKVRENFTRATVAKMWADNKDKNKYPAVACYNKGYALKNPGGVDGKITAKLSLGALNTDYDCMYIKGPNQFYTRGNGGFINLAYQYNSARCSFDQKTGDLTCN